jgi:hypothetical protein
MLGSFFEKAGTSKGVTKAACGVHRAIKQQLNSTYFRKYRSTVKINKSEMLSLLKNEVPRDALISTILQALQENFFFKKNDINMTN